MRAMVSSPRPLLPVATALLAVATVLGLGTGVVIGALDGGGSGESASAVTSPTNTGTVTGPTATPSPSPTANPITSPTPSTPPGAPTIPADTDLEKGMRTDVGYLVSSQARPDGTHVSFDRVQVRTATSASKSEQKEKKDKGRRPRGNTLIINESGRLRDLVLSPEVQVYGRLQLAGRTEAEPIPVAALLAAVPAKGRAVPLDLRYNELGYVIEVRER